MQISIQTDLRQLIADGRRSERALQYTFGKLVDLATWTFDRLIDLTPKSGRSREGERVADSWELKYQGYVLWRELAWSVESDNIIIDWLEFGTRDHWIAPRSPGGTLHWIDPATGEDRFSKGHMVSGIRPVGMIRQTEAELGARLRRIRMTAEARVSN